MRKGLRDPRETPSCGESPTLQTYTHMTIHIVLHVVDGDHLLFAGLPADCPPIPRVGDELVHNHRRVRLEGVRYQYSVDHLEIALLA